MRFTRGTVSEWYRGQRLGTYNGMTGHGMKWKERRGKRQGMLEGGGTRTRPRIGIANRQQGRRGGETRVQLYRHR